jgi:hypothetical protein
VSYVLVKVDDILEERWKASEVLVLVVKLLLIH